MSEPKITTIFLMWDVRYLEDGEEKFRIEQDYMLGPLQQFVKDKETTSITFYAKGLTERVGNKSYEGRIHEETLNKEDFLQLNRAWLDERKKNFGIV